MLHGQTHAVGRDIGIFRDVVPTAQRDVSIHVFHFRQQVLGNDAVLRVVGTHQHFARKAAVVDA